METPQIIIISMLGIAVLALIVLRIVYVIAANRFTKSEEGKKVLECIKTTTRISLFELSKKTDVEKKKLINYAGYLCNKELKGQYYYHRSDSLILKGISPKELKRIEQDKLKPKDPNAFGSVEGIVLCEIIGVTNKKDSKTMITNAMVGDIFLGFKGALIGAALTENITQLTFLIFYKNGNKNIETVNVSSERSKQLIVFVKNKE